MSKKIISQEVEIRECDYCGKPATGMYSSCDCCDKDICRAHSALCCSEDDSYCLECYSKGYDWIQKKMTKDREKRVAAIMAEKEAHKGQIKVDGIWMKKQEYLMALNIELKQAISEMNRWKIESLTNKIKGVLNDY